MKYMNNAVLIDIGFIYFIYLFIYLFNHLTDSIENILPYCVIKGVFSI